MPDNFAAESFHTKKLCSRLSSRKVQFFIRKMEKNRFWDPLWGLGATYGVHPRLIGKLVGDFLLVIIELFFARCFRFVTIHAFDRRTDNGRTDGQTECRQQYRAYASQSHGNKRQSVVCTGAPETRVRGQVYHDGTKPDYRCQWAILSTERSHAEARFRICGHCAHGRYT